MSVAATAVAFFMIRRRHGGSLCCCRFPGSRIVVSGFQFPVGVPGSSGIFIVFKQDFFVFKLQICGVFNQQICLALPVLLSDSMLNICLVWFFRHFPIWKIRELFFKLHVKDTFFLLVTQFIIIYAVLVWFIIVEIAFFCFPTCFFFFFLLYGLPFLICCIYRIP